ncbi:MAG: putative repeat protein [Phenylobacterium sp.]|nr:putative repeat protein [Phenylobacterium sp.]
MPTRRTLTADELYHQALAAADADRPGEAEALLRAAFRVAKGPNLLVTLGVVLEHQGRFDAARAIFRAALAATPDEPLLNFPLALNLLRAGQYAEGLRLYESRDVRITRTAAGRPTLSFPEWTGGPLRSLVILPEQGLGDEIMFNRYVPQLKARGVEVTLLCRPSLARLLAPLGVRLLPLGPTVEVPHADAWTLSPSLPLRLATTPATVPPPAYLPGGPGGKGVGVMTVGSVDPDPRRALPRDLAEQLLALPGAVSLDPAVTGAKDFEDTRAIIAGLDLVITVDTAVAHLAGAMGKPCWTLIPFVPDWRWMEKGPHSPWYPEMRLFRQPELLDWESVVREVLAAFRARP